MRGSSSYNLTQMLLYNQNMLLNNHRCYRIPYTIFDSWHDVLHCFGHLTRVLCPTPVKMFWICLCLQVHVCKKMHAYCVSQEVFMRGKENQQTQVSWSCSVNVRLMIILIMSQRDSRIWWLKLSC